MEERERENELTAKVPLLPEDETRTRARQLLPGLIVIGLYMLLMAVRIVLDVLRGSASPVYLLESVLFVASGFGLVRLFRWAWALVLGAMFLQMFMFARLWAGGKVPPVEAFMQIALNVLLFLYLTREDVRSRLR